jgi:hypothetical protein
VERSVLTWLRAELDDPQIVGSDNFLDIGGHSLTFSRLNIFLAESFGVTLDMKTAYEHTISHAVAGMRPGEAAGAPHDAVCGPQDKEE